MFHNLFNSYRIFQNFLIEVNYIFLLACFSAFKFVDIKLLIVFSIIFLIWSICNYVPLFILNVYVCLFFLFFFWPVLPDICLFFLVFLKNQLLDLLISHLVSVPITLKLNAYTSLWQSLPILQPEVQPNFLYCLGSV